MRGRQAEQTRALRRLEECDQAVREASERLSAAELERARVARSLDRVVAPLRSYHEDLAAGEREPDAALERKLTVAVTEVQSSGLVSAQPLYAGGNIIGMRVVDERVEAKVAGTQRLVQTKRNERSAFVREHAEELQAELLEHAEAARDGLLSAWQGLQAAAGDWSRVRGRFAALADQWGLSPAELPPNPLAGATQEVERAFAPMAGGVPRDPRRFVPAPISLLEEASDDA